MLHAEQRGENVDRVATVDNFNPVGNESSFARVFDYLKVGRIRTLKTN